MATPTLRQESTIELGERQLTVVSEILLEPEVMVMTQVYSGEKLLRKTHTVLPPAAIRDYERRGTAALTSSLYAFHLRFVRKLLSATPESRPQRPLPAGVLAVTRIDPEGKLRQTAGEDHIPPSWLHNAPTVASAAREMGRRLGLGPLELALVESEHVALLLLPSGDQDVAAFLESGAEELIARAVAHLREGP
jgi:hypothetical protein